MLPSRDGSGEVTVVGLQDHNVFPRDPKPHRSPERLRPSGHAEWLLPKDRAGLHRNRCAAGDRVSGYASHLSSRYWRKPISTRPFLPPGIDSTLSRTIALFIAGCCLIQYLEQDDKFRDLVKPNIGKSYMECRVRDETTSSENILTWAQLWQSRSRCYSGCLQLMRSLLLIRIAGCSYLRRRRMLPLVCCCHCSDSQRLCNQL